MFPGTELTRSLQKYVVNVTRDALSNRNHDLASVALISRRDVCVGGRDKGRISRGKGMRIPARLTPDKHELAHGRHNVTFIPDIHH